MSDEKTSQQTVREMAKLALASNRISDVQEKNLKMYPFVFFNGVLSANIDYDFTNNQHVETEEKVNSEEDVKKGKEKLEIKYKFNKLTTEHFHVTYRLSIAKDAENENLEKRFDILTKAIRGLFWNETKVKVFFNNELKYESKDV